MKQGEEAAVAYLNSHGGIFGKPVKLTVLDDGGDPTKAVSLAEQMISSGNEPDAVIPGVLPTVTSAVVPVLAKAGIFTVQHGTDPTLNNPQKYPDVFGTSYLPSDWAANLADTFAQKGYKTVAMLTSNDVSGHAQATGAQAAMQAKGITLKTVFIPATAFDATSEMEQAVATKPDALLLSGYGATAGPTIKAYAQLGVKIPTYGTQYFAANNLSQVAPASDYKGVTLQALAWAVKGSTQTQTPAFSTFFSELQKQTGGTIPFGMFTYVVNWDDVMVAATAAKLANSTDPAKMAAAMDHVTAAQMPMYLGPVDYSTTNHYPRYTDTWWPWIPYSPSVDGQFVPANS